MQRLTFLAFALFSLLPSSLWSDDGNSTNSALLSGLPHLIEVEQITRRENYAAPIWSPDGNKIAATTDGYKGLFLIGRDHKVSRLKEPDDQFSAYHMRWSEDGQSIIGEDRSQQKLVAITFRGSEAPAESAALESAKISVANDQIMLLQEDGTLRQISFGEDRYLAPIYSPDKAKVVYLGVMTGLFLYDIETGETTAIGQGDYAAWSPDGRFVIFDYARDNGHEITASELYLYDTERKLVTQLTDTPNRIERRPQFSNDGERIAFDDQGAIMVGKLLH